MPWWWTVTRSRSTCDECRETIGAGNRFAYQHPEATVLCELCADRSGVGAEAKESRRLAQDQRLQRLGLSNAERAARLKRREIIERGKSPRGGWTRATLARWGVPWPPPRGWKKKLERQGFPSA